MGYRGYHMSISISHDAGSSGRTYPRARMPLHYQPRSYLLLENSQIAHLGQIIHDLLGMAVARAVGTEKMKRIAREILRRILN